MKQSKKILIMAGGTGGHVFPGIALAEALKQENVNVFWLGTKGGMEATWVNNAQLPLQTISIKGLRGNGLKGWLKAPFNILKARAQAKKIMQDIQPDLVLGMGGFVCGPGGLAAKSLGIPLVLHEQNAIPGLTNKLLARFANLVITAFPQNKIHGKNVVTIGNPVREGLEDIEQVENTQPCHLLVLGGSRGALALNETLPKALALMDEANRPVVKHQTGEKTLQQAQQAYQEAGVQAEVVPFIDNMLLAYASADMVLCRSGALTVSELMASARPAIMVPYPHAVDDHQTANAKALVDLDGGEIIQQDVLTPEKLANALTDWCENPDKRVKASLSIRIQAKTQAKEKIVSELMAIING
ncbi:undecaprenyldiphospho-muramoylpentapeptide beta-N-acetylglucosaminyltransferase [Thiomicrorhabdus sp. Milos-T2]|uniref:undecaprenyldiphospho-muramoylpentapeptide beta-N-acetylglucosaminyltransferase n=1 Tax=Thiomicrorhabdus sp. Milos-T2 TaxID=90814 RepID=UPI0004945809|nr:undecaprenyldiphospho-muramoylpentapeptide beta-N-acetylglucosaminyltransferase [Thiomicrorhabdus sp. Milos-T2]